MKISIFERNDHLKRKKMNTNAISGMQNNYNIAIIRSLAILYYEKLNNSTKNHPIRYYALNFNY